MSFQWQSLDEAAKTLEVDLETLNHLIEQGRAPTRSHDGRTEVLIEFPDEDDEPDDTAEESAAGATDSASSAGEHASGAAASADHVIDAEPFENTATGVQLVTHRELQLAGGLAATWQRMAEQTERELKRSRRVAAIGWSLLGVLILLAGVGIYFATRTTADAQAEARLSQYELERTAADRDALDQRATQLTERIETLTTSLAEARADARLSQDQLERLAADREAREQRSAELAQRIETLSAALVEAQTELARTSERAEQLAARSSESTEQDRALAAMRESLERQQSQINQLHETLAAARTDLEAARATAEPGVSTESTPANEHTASGTPAEDQESTPPPDDGDGSGAEAPPDDAAEDDADASADESTDSPNEEADEDPEVEEAEEPT